MLVFDLQTGRLRLESDREAAPGAGDEFATAPPLISADGTRAFSPAGSGRIAGIPVIGARD